MKGSGDDRIAAWLEPHVFGHRTLILAVFAVVTVVLGWIAVTVLKSRQFHQAAAARGRVHPDLPRPQGGSRRREPAADRAGRARRQHVHAGILPGAQDRDRRRCSSFDGVDRARVQSLWTPNTRYTEVVEGDIEAGDVMPSDFQPDADGLGGVKENILEAASSAGGRQRSLRRFDQRAASTPTRKPATGGLHRDTGAYSKTRCAPASRAPNSTSPSTCRCRCT